MKDIIKVLIAILLVGSIVTAGVSVSKTITLTKERKAITDDWGLENLEVTNISLGGEMWFVHVKPNKTPPPSTQGEVNTTIISIEDWVQQRYEGFMDKEIVYRNKTEPATEIWDFR